MVLQGTSAGKQFKVKAQGDTISFEVVVETGRLTLDHRSFIHEIYERRYSPYLNIWHNHQQSIDYKGAENINWRYTLSKDESLLLVRLYSADVFTSHFNYNVKDHKLELTTEDLYHKAVDELVLEHLLKKHPGYGSANVKSSTEKTSLKAQHDVSQVRRKTESCDFSIVCQNGVSILVHSLILSTYWPYYESMMENDCLEKTEKVLKLDYPEMWVQKLICYLYGEELELKYEEMTGLMLLGELYQLPELVELMTAEILAVSESSLSLLEVVSGWKRANEASNEKIRRHLARMVVLKRSEFKDELSELSELCTVQEALSLLADTLAVDVK